MVVVLAADNNLNYYLHHLVVNHNPSYCFVYLVVDIAAVAAGHTLDYSSIHLVVRISVEAAADIVVIADCIVKVGLSIAEVSVEQGQMRDLRK